MNIINRKSQAQQEHVDARIGPESAIRWIGIHHRITQPNLTTAQVENEWQKPQVGTDGSPVGWPSNCPCSTCDLVMSLN